MFGVNWAWSVVDKFGVTPEKVEKTKMEFLAWLGERNLDVPKDAYEFLKTFKAFREDTAGRMSITDWILGLIIAAILDVGVALPHSDRRRADRTAERQRNNGDGDWRDSSGGGDLAAADLPREVKGKREVAYGLPFF